MSRLFDMGRIRPSWWWPLLLVPAVLMPVGGDELSAQPQGPIKLFPGVEDERRPEAPEAPAGRPRPRVAPGLPEAPAADPVRVQGLAAPAIDAIGRPGGLDPDIWRGTDPALATRLIEQLPLPRNNRPLRELTRRILITGAVFPGSGRAGDMLAARVDRLLAMGALDDAGALLDQMPNPDDDTALTRRAAEVALWRGDAARACGLADRILPASEARFWGKLEVFCRLRAGEPEGADLALSLLREPGAVDDERFLALAEGREVAPAAAPWTALHVAMLRDSGAELPADALDDPPPVLLAAVATSPELAPDRSLGFAERAYALGALDRTRLVERYRAATGDAGGLEARIEDAPLPEARAALLAYAGSSPGPADLARFFDLLWSRTPPQQQELAGAVFAPVLNRLEAAGELLFAAPAVARALLVADYPASAARWYALLRDAADDDVSAREAAVALAPALTIAGSDAAAPRPDALAAESGGSVRLLALAEGSGQDLPLEAWWRVAKHDAEGTLPLPPGVIWRVLERSRAGSGAAGETILAALHLLGGDPLEAHPEAVVAGLDGLRAAGQGAAARRIATVAAVQLGT